MLASGPDSILNQNRSDLGIPNRFNPKESDSSFFFAIAPALMLLNFLLAQIPSLRRIFDRNAEGVPGASYRAAMKALWKVAKIIIPPALALGLLGAIEPWAL